VRTGKQAFSIAAVVLMLAAVQTTAATYTWTPTAAGTYSWDDATSQWTSGFPNAAGDIANLNIDLAGTQTINLNQTITVGTINIGDTTTAFSGVTIAPGTGGSLIMDVSSGGNLINKATSGNAVVDTISANIQLNDNLVVTNAAAGGALTISGNVSGSNYTLEKIGAGTLNLNGSTTVKGLIIGYRTAGGSVIAGSSATLSVGSGSSDNLYVGVGYNGSSGNSGILDVSNTVSFAANVGNLFVGVNIISGGSGAAGNGTLRLGTNNTITATNFVMAGGEPDGNTGIANGNTAVLTTAPNSITTIVTPVMAIGTVKSSGGTFTLGSGATLNLGNSGARTSLTLGRHTAWTYGGGPGTMDLSGGGTGVAKLYLSKLVLGIYINGTTGDTSTHARGYMILGPSSSNHLDISGSGNVVSIGYTDNNGGAQGIGSLVVSNLDATSLIISTDNNTAILIAQQGNHAASGLFSLCSGSLAITTTGSAIAGGGGTSTLNLKDCTLIAGASSTNWIQSLTTATLTNTVTFNTGTNTVVIPQAFSGNSAMTKSGTGILMLSGANTYTGTTTVATGTLALASSGSVASTNITIAAGAALDVTNKPTYTLGAATNYYLGVSPAGSGSAGRINAAGSTLDISNAKVNLNITGTLDDQVYVLADYGTLAGSAFAATNGVPSGYTINYAYNSGTQIVLLNPAVTLFLLH